MVKINYQLSNLTIYVAQSNMLSTQNACLSNSTAGYALDNKFLAHSENSDGKLHNLNDHLCGVKNCIVPWAISHELAKHLSLAALIHDFGKYLEGFQRYIRGKGPSTPHSRWGAMLAKCLQAEEVSFAVDGHHAGLPDYNKWKDEHTYTDDDAKKQLEELLYKFMADTGLTQPQLTDLLIQSDGGPREWDIRTRYIFSCLTDGDWLDTEEHFSPHKTALRVHRSLDVEKSIALVDAELNRLSDQSKPINQLRTQARVQALTKASLPTGFFSLNLPTGLGKTLTSFRWALEHAKANNLERIIVVLPFTNIIDQTANRLKEILGNDSVIEHHASYTPTIDANERADQHKLACENWDAPIILTTTVQFFETLFSNLPGKCRKLHNISKSVVILDEVQTLPKKIVLPSLDMLQDVHHVMNTSFVFCTATMPAFEKRAAFPGISNITELADDPAALFNKTQRVRYSLLNDLQPTDQTRLQEALKAQTASTLVIANTKRIVLELYKAASSWHGWDAVYHLSTGMCPHHRKRIINEIYSAVKGRSKKILVFSTQLVEAGVDLDFPCVFRELAPLESIIQAAGRCNREGLLPEGIVTLFCLSERKFPDKFYKTQAEVVSTLLAATPDCLYTYETFHRYYAQIMGLHVEHQPVTQQREKRDFSTTAAMYRVISNNTQPVFVWDYNNDSRKLYDTLRAKERAKLPLSRDEFRAMQQFSVQVYDTDLFKSTGSWEQAYSGLLIWNGEYNAHTGLHVTPQNADGIIF